MKAEKQTIHINVAGREYPLVVQPGEETVLKAAAEKINAAVNHLSSNYAINDKQDLLAMAWLQLSVSEDKAGVRRDEREEEKALLQAIQSMVQNAVSR